MKLDKIAFARVVTFTTAQGLHLDEAGLMQLDNLIDISEPCATVSLTPKCVKENIDEMLEALIEGNKIPAIKAYRAVTDTSLKESKETIEQVTANYRRAVIEELANRLCAVGHVDAAGLLNGFS